MKISDPAVAAATLRDLTDVRAIAQVCLDDSDGQPSLKQMNVALKAMYAAIGRNLQNMRRLGPDVDPLWLATHCDIPY